MGGLKSSTQSSLERLKALDTVTDLEGQIREATELCTHGSRAEMILRWMADKMRQSSTIREEYTSWNLLSLTVRLLPPHRTATLLGSTCIPDILTTTCSGVKLSQSLMVAIQNFLELLLSIGDGPDGGPVKAVISLNNAKAAAFCGAWLRQFHAERISRQTSILPDDATIDVALRVWALRRMQQDDDNIFTEHCLVPVLELLVVSGATRLSVPLKRCRHMSTQSSVPGNWQSLRSLLARHCILPARTAFKKTRDVNMSRTNNEVDETHSLTLSDVLKLVEDQLADPDRSLSLSCLPLLLEIALLSVNISSLRHQQREQPWIEHIFGALLKSYGCPASDNVVIRHPFLLDMLEFIHQHGSLLSPEKLSDIVKTYAIASADIAGKNDWNLVAKIVEVNVNTFTIPSIAELLFNAISAEGELDPMNTHRAALVNGRIFEPITAAFAQGRNLSRFIALWKKQLLRLTKFSGDHVWLRICPIFADHLESSYSHAQILDLVENLQSAIAATEDTRDDAAELELNADLVLLSAVLSGIQSDELLEKIHDSLSNLLQQLLQIAVSRTQGSLSDLEVPYWQCLTKIFNVWFPLWAINDQDPEAIQKKVGDLLSNPAFKIGLTVCGNTKSKSGSLLQQNLVQEAGMYLATLSNAGRRFQENAAIQDACTQIVERLATASHQHLPSFIVYPNLLIFLSHSKRRQFFMRIFEDAVNHEVSDLRAAVDAFSLHAALEIRVDLLSLLVESLQNGSDDKTASKAHEEVVTVALSVPGELFTNEQRETMLKTLLNPQYSPYSSCTLHQAGQYLALILTLIQTSGSSPSNYVHLNHLWHFGNSVGRLASFALGNDRQNNAIFEMITRLVVGSWLGRHQNTKASEAIMDLAQTIKSELDTSSGKDVAKISPGASVVIKVFMEAIREDRYEKVIQDHAIRDPDVTKLYVKGLAKEASRMAKRLEAKPDSSVDDVRWTTLLNIFTTAMAVATGSHSETSKYRKQLADVSANMLDQFNLAQIGHLGRATLVYCFQIMSDLNNERCASLVTAATKLLGDDITASENHKIISTFSKVFTEGTASDKEFILEQLFTPKSDGLTSHMILQQAAIACLTKEDLEATGDARSSKYLLHNLAVISAGGSLQTTQAGLRTADLVLREKSFMVNQHSIEQTISALHQLTTQSTHIAAHYSDICQVVLSILTQHRARVQDRLHLILTLLQALLVRLLQSQKAQQPISQLNARHATAFSRVLVVLCNRRAKPRHNHHSHGKPPSDLVDVARKAQARVGRSVQFLLHQYCAQILTSGGSMAAGVREALVPGIWAVIEAIEGNGPDAIRALSAAMNHSERAVLRSLYDDWKRFGKWEGL